MSVSDEYVAVAPNDDNRGNLSKETTNKLRAWFHARLQHPYPPKEEKQELVRQTSLRPSEFFLVLH